MGNPTIHDVAARAGVSKSTVSLVLQQSPLVKAATRAAVQRAMGDLGYVYNAAAAGLRGKVQSPALQTSGPPAHDAPPPTPSLALSTDLSDPNCAAFAAALQVVAGLRGLSLQLLAQGAPWQGRRITTRPSESGQPSTLFALHPDAPARLQDGMAAQAATRHLLGLGAAQVAFVGGSDSDSADQLRLAGYLARMKRADTLPLVMMGGHDFAFGRRIGATILKRFPICTAALCINDQIALGLIEALGEHGIPLGDGFRVVGWGDSAAAAEIGLSSLQPDLAGLASACTAWALDGGAGAFEIPLHLVRRKSSTGTV
ncbi:MAG: LacI family DNA-binding transcriptional regulator [Cypionkella sp.]